jgi:glutathione S-transferase
LHVFGFHVLHHSILKCRHFRAGCFQNRKHRVAVKIHNPANGADAHAFAKQVHHLASLFEVHAQAVQRLLVGKRLSAAVALVALHGKVFIRKTSGFFHFIRLAAMAVHLDLSRPSLTVIL